MIERPIIMNAVEVHAVLAGTKTQVRRPIKGTTDKKWEAGQCELSSGEMRWNIGGDSFRSPFGGFHDRLWVRETHILRGNEDGHYESAEGKMCSEREAQVYYRADAKPTTYGQEELPDGSLFDGGWRPSIHMPRWASRITLEITDMRVQRLQDISEDDIWAEGIRITNFSESVERKVVLGDGFKKYAPYFTSLCASWSSNPWVWAITFKRVKP